MPRLASCVPASTLALLLLAAPASAQTPTLPFPQEPVPLAKPAEPDPAEAEDPPPGWTGSFGAGLALTQGNSDTSTINAAYEVMRDAGGPFLFRSNLLYIRGSSESELTTNRISIDARADRRITGRTSVYAQIQTLHDRFKEIDYLVAPTVGASHTPVRNDRVELGLDTGVGAVHEKNREDGSLTSGALTMGQNLKIQLSSAAELTQRTSALWKVEDFGDALYIFAAGISANVTARTQMKTEVLNTLKNRTPSAEVSKNDVALLVSVVYKF